MRWINPPASVKRFSLQQILQHAAASLIGVLLAASAIGLSNGPGSAAWRSLHQSAGLFGAALLAIHLFSLLVIGVRHDVATDNIAFLPIRPMPEGEEKVEGKYSLAEKWDYLLLLTWSAAVVVTGIMLRWPSRFGVPGPLEYQWLRIVHAGCGAAWTIHLVATHAAGRLLDGIPGTRRAIFTGRVPIESIESRKGWVRDLIASGVLVPVPEERVEESERETAQVRELLESGNRLTRDGRFDEAAMVFDEALRLYPDYSQARFNLGVARLKQGREDLAAEQFVRFIEMDPFNPMASKARELLAGITGTGRGGAS
jgi:tetratricopeptide (TPR) repeat protein